MSCNQKDLANKKYWDGIYADVVNLNDYDWKPQGYNELLLDKIISQTIEKYKPQRILEIGCGNSVWLPYIAKKYKVKVAGIDYSEKGCQLVRDKLTATGVAGDIYCIDLLNYDGENEIGEFDLVFSLGVIEHFSNTENILNLIKRFVKKGGILLTEIPNLNYFNGLVSKIYQPAVLSKHYVIDEKALKFYYQKAALNYLSSGYLGRISLNLIAWGVQPRFLKLDKIILPSIRNLANKLDKINEEHFSLKGNKLFSPFIYIVGRK